MDYTFQSGKQLERHLLSVHQCSKRKDPATGKDRAFNVSAKIARSRLFTMSRPKRRPRNHSLQQSLYDVAVGVVVSRYAFTVSVTFIFEPVTMNNWSVLWPKYSKYVSFGSYPFSGSGAVMFTIFLSPSLPDLNLRVIHCCRNFPKCTVNTLFWFGLSYERVYKKNVC